MLNRGKEMRARSCLGGFLFLAKIRTRLSGGGEAGYGIGLAWILGDGGLKLANRTTWV